MISVAENSNKFPKTRFWKEKLVDFVTIGPMAQATLVNSKSTLKGSTLSIQSQLAKKEDPIVELFARDALQHAFTTHTYNTHRTKISVLERHIISMTGSS